LIAGTGPAIQELRALVAHLGSDVTFLGYLEGEALHDVLGQARAIVLPSEWYENAPVALLEAYALGKPVIGARIGGIPELIREPETGATFTSGDVTSLTTALRSMAERSAARIEDMGRCARAWVEAEFSAEMYRERILDIYGELGVKASSV
jgi:glycosyltransferase involved in cell wall biosynthesis